MSAVWSVCLPHTDKLVLLALADNANDEGHCWPAVSTLATKCGLETRSVSRVMERLEREGHLTRHERPGRSNSYSIHPRLKVTPDLKSPLTESHTTPDQGSPPPLTHSQGTPDLKSPITIIEPSIEPPSNHQRAREVRKVSRGAESPEWFLDFKLAYPDRAGDQGWRKCLKAANARMGEGHTSAEFIAGARRYAAFCEATGKIGGEYVKQACTFLGPDKPFLLPWKPPPRAETASERILRTLEGPDNSRVIEHDDGTTPFAIARQ